MVTKSSPFTCSIPLLPSLHWLPVRFRIPFKINLLTYNTLREKQPVCLHSMLAASIPFRYWLEYVIAIQMPLDELYNRDKTNPLWLGVYCLIGLNWSRQYGSIIIGLCTVNHLWLSVYVLIGADSCGSIIVRLCTINPI